MSRSFRDKLTIKVEKIWIAFANLSMQRKLLIVFLFLVSLPLILVSYASYYSYSRSIETNTEAYATEITSKMMTKLDDYVTDLYNMSAMPLYNEDFLRGLSQPGQDLFKQRDMDTYVLNLNKIKPDTVSVYVFDKYGNVFYNIKSGGKRSNFNEVKSVWEKIAAEGGGRPRLVSTQEVDTDRSTATYYAFSVIRELKGTWDMEPVGYIVFDTNITAISRQIQSVDEVTKGKTVLVDENNVVVFDSERKQITRNLSSDESIRRAVDSKGSFQIQMAGKPYICTYVISELTHWKMLVYIPLGEVTRQASVTRNFTLMITAAIVAFALFIAIAISVALTRPLRKIKLLMQEVQRGNLDVSFNLKYSDEVGLLGRHFNMMISRVQTLLEEVEFTQARKKEAELVALQSQINPHFIYNTLEMIRMTAEVNDDDEVADMTYILGKLLRYGVNHANRSVTIREEIDHLQNYVSLQNMRFADRYKLIIHISEEIYGLPCSKLIFQPIVENAIHHAFKDKPEAGTIGIAAVQDGEDVVIHLSDDGAGMDAKSLKKLRDHIAGVQLLESGRGIGLRNINERIKLQFGERYGLKVESRENIGTIVSLRLPGITNQISLEDR